MEVNIAPGWKLVLKEEFEQPYFKDLVELLKNEKQSNQKIFPPGNQIFNAFNLTDFDQVKIVILGQDPYHGPGQAHGLSFSVTPPTPLPPSLKNIFKEIQSDIGVKMPKHHGDLSPWARQGVLLLNATLTVRANDPNSHSGIGWQKFTDAVVRKLNENKQHLVFILWGNFAKQKGEFIDQKKHLVLKAAHPSPFSADKGFFGCRHFSMTNEYLVKHGQEPINWMINE